jgi:cytochrome c oxidase subunit II
LPSSPNHARRVIVAWIVLSLIATPLVAIFLGPAIPPGNGSVQASGQTVDNTVILSILTPIICLLLVFFAYALTQFRKPRGGEIVDGPPLRNQSTVQLLWVSLSAVIVLFLAAFGTYELLQNGAGGGQGPDPVAVPSGAKLQIQVIAQQWEFTYRYPTFGGIETAHLELPVGRQVAFHVTSLDVIHSFWAPKLGVKADANPGVDNIAYVKPEEEESFELRCSELCGLWHGYMFDTGQIVSPAAFLRWIHEQRRVFAPAAKVLPPYANHYFPEPDRRAG